MHSIPEAVHRAHDGIWLSHLRCLDRQAKHAKGFGPSVVVEAIAEMGAELVHAADLRVVDAILHYVCRLKNCSVG